MRTTRTQIGRALADRLNRRHVVRATTLDVARREGAAASRPASPTERLRRLLGAARVTPYQLRRGWLW